MKKSIVSLTTLAVMGLSAAVSMAQEAPKSSAGGTKAAPAAAQTEGQSTQPAGAAGAPQVEGGAEVVKPKGASGVVASPGMKPKVDDAAKPEPGARNAGENVGVAPGAKPADLETKPGTATGQQKAGAPAAGEQNPGTKATGSAARHAPRLSGEQRTRVVTAFRHADFKPVHVDFDIKVGLAVPRTVVLAPLPPEIITYVPEYEGFRFFYLPGRIVVVDPDTFEIVDVIPV